MNPVRLGGCCCGCWNVIVEVVVAAGVDGCVVAVVVVGLMVLVVRWIVDDVASKWRWVAKVGGVVSFS